MNRDFKDMFRMLNEHRVRYLVVGAYAVTFYAEPRYTKDLDIWVEPSAENAKKVWDALAAFGAPLDGIRVEAFADDHFYTSLMNPRPKRLCLMGPAGITAAVFAFSF